MSMGRKLSGAHLCGSLLAVAVNDAWEGEGVVLGGWSSVLEVISASGERLGPGFFSAFVSRLSFGGPNDMSVADLVSSYALDHDEIVALGKQVAFQGYADDMSLLLNRGLDPNLGDGMLLAAAICPHRENALDPVLKDATKRIEGESRRAAMARVLLRAGARLDLALQYLLGEDVSAELAASLAASSAGRTGA
jgi:hypothetical protein